MFAGGKTGVEMFGNMLKSMIPQQVWDIIEKKLPEMAGKVEQFEKDLAEQRASISELVAEQRQLRMLLTAHFGIIPLEAKNGTAEIRLVRSDEFRGDAEGDAGSCGKGEGHSSAL